jgi:hypothetical protein
VSAASGLHYGTFFGGNQTGTSAAEPGNRGRCLAVFESGTYAGMALFSGVTTATDFGAVGGVGGLTTPGVVQRDWLTGDQRAGFIAIHDVY